MRSLFVLVNLNLMILMTACAPSPFADNWPQARPLGQDIPAYIPPKEPPSESASSDSPDPVIEVVEEPADALSLRQALALSLIENPELRSFAWEVRLAEAQLLQESVLPNPELAIEVENVAGSGDFSGMDAAETTVALGQLIELGGKRSKRMRIAALDQELAGWDYEAKRIELLTEVSRRFIEVLSAQKRVALTKEAAKLSEAFYENVSKRVEAGAVSSVERTRASVVVSTSRLEIQRAKRQLQVARYELAIMWGNKNPRFAVAVGDLNSIATIPSAESLARLIGQNPDIARWAVEITKRQAAIELADSQSVPDVELGAGFRHFNETDDSAMVFGISLPLPIFDQNQGGKRGARIALIQANQQRREAEGRISNALSVGYQELAAAHNEAMSLREEVLPAARESFEATYKAFIQGKFGYLDVLDTQRTLIESQSQYLDAAVAYHNAVAEVEGLIGQSLSAIASDSENNHELEINNGE